MTAIEVPQKRRRLLGHGRADKELQARRAQQELQLKSRFESIFEKYERDFTGVGDEIDLETGEIVINNGHIQSMKYERDTGNGIDGQMVDITLSVCDGTDDEGSMDIEDDDAESTASAACQAPCEQKSPSLSAFAGLDDYDELGESPPRGKAEVVSTDDPDIDELALAHLQSVAPFKDRPRPYKRILDEAGLAIEPRWIAPSLPHERSKFRPLHRRIFPALPLKHIRRDGLDLSGWNQKGSIWDTRPDSNEPAEIVLEEQEKDEDAVEEEHVERASSQVPWTREEDAQLRGLKASVRLSDDELRKYFPGKTASSLTTRWDQMKASDQLQRELNAKTQSLAFTELPEDINGVARGIADQQQREGRERQELQIELREDNGQDGAVVRGPVNDSSARNSETVSQKGPREPVNPLPSSSRPAGKLSNNEKKSFQTAPKSKRRGREVLDSDSPNPSSSPMVTQGMLRLDATSLRSSPIVHVISDSEDEASSEDRRSANVSRVRGQTSVSVAVPARHGPSKLSRKSQEPKQAQSSDLRREIPDSQPSQILSSVGEHSTPRSTRKAVGTLPRPNISSQGTTRANVGLPDSSTTTHTGLATPKSFKALRAAGSSQRSTTKKFRPTTSLSQLCDEESDDDLSKPIPASAPGTLKKPPASTPLSKSAIPREARECSEDELG